MTESTAPASRTLYRTMLDDGSSRPRLADDANSLGVRFDPKASVVRDLDLDGETWVPKKDPQGMSIQINDPMSAPVHRRPKALRGIAKGDLWDLDEVCVPALLRIVPDGRRMDAQHGHAVLEATRRCTIHEYKQALEQSQPAWRKTDVSRFR
jgi:hypothetical protein